MIYVALLRGINVGGKARVEMARLKRVFLACGFENVATYINSGNVIFIAPKTPVAKLAKIIEEAIAKEFHFNVPVIVRDVDNIRTINKAIPAHWTNGKDMKCDVLFLWDKFDYPGIIKEIIYNPDIEKVSYAAGAVIWSIDRKFATRSKLNQITGTELYRHITIRNLNTTRKLLHLMEEMSQNRS